MLKGGALLIDAKDSDIIIGVEKLGSGAGTKKTSEKPSEGKKERVGA